jgi:peptidoglycan/xylan/chitin deacetylase (PgdA/CDA1 family)
MSTAIAFVAINVAASTPQLLVAQPLRDKYDAIVRGDVTAKKLALVFTGDQHGEGTTYILNVLKDRKLKASFFVTGNFLRDMNFRPQLNRMIAEGHYLGPHSDSHPLYCSWDDRDKSLVTQAFFTADLRKNIADLRAIGALSDGAPIYLIPPYEWHNRQHVEWCRDVGVTMINFTPGSGSNRDYAPEGHARFVPSGAILNDILAYEKKDPQGLNGFLLLMHVGSGRKDGFHVLLGRLSDELAARDYKLERVDELLNHSP